MNRILSFLLFAVSALTVTVGIVGLYYYNNQEDDSLPKQTTNKTVNNGKNTKSKTKVISLSKNDSKISIDSSEPEESSNSDDKTRDKRSYKMIFINNNSDQESKKSRKRSMKMKKSMDVREPRALFYKKNQIK